jgi:hypothetical protein
MAIPSLPLDRHKHSADPAGGRRFLGMRNATRTRRNPRIKT